MKSPGYWLLALLAVLAVLLAGCETAANLTPKATPAAQQNLKKDFELKLYTDKKTYKTNEKITVWATLKYVGDQSQVTIWHADPYIAFLISDGKSFNTGGVAATVLSSTVLEKGKLYQFAYQKSGGFDENDANAAFWKKFYAQKDLYLPAGHYTITTRGDFSLTQESVSSANNLKEAVEIVVTD